jgi:aldehyde:ferredoxin oxidoreductase
MILTKYIPKNVINGNTDQILWIDLSQNTVKLIDIDSKMKEEFVGGRGYAIKLLYDYTNEKTEPLGPDNLFIISAGPMVGQYLWPGGTKTVTACISPSTNGYAESSVGGAAGEKLKFAGFDVICITGKAKNYSSIIVDGIKGEIRLEDAPDEIDSLKIGEYFIDNFGKKETGAFTIGIGGRNLVKYACINGIHFDGEYYIPRQAGRTGTGAVLGSKNIVAVVAIASKESKKNAVIPNKDSLKDAGKKMRKVIQENDKTQLDLYHHGTAGLVEMMNEVDILPVKNFSTSNVKEAEGLDSSVFTTKIFQKTVPCCPGCNLACGKLAKGKAVDGGEVFCDGPDYETIGMLGSNIGIFSADWVVESNYICDYLGIDTISSGNVIGYVMECFEKGFLTSKDTDGLEITFGNIPVSKKLLHKIANRTGFGDILAEGVVGVIDYIIKRDNFEGDKKVKLRNELESFAMHSKGLEVSAYIPRSSIAQQVAYGTSLIGAHHREAWLIAIDALRNEIPTFKEKSEILVWFQNLRTWVDIVGVCKLHWIDVRNPASKQGDPRNLATVDLYIQAVNAVIGRDLSLDDHFLIAERSYSLAKLINLRRGLSKKDDHLPKRGMGKVTLEDYDKLLEKYYEIRGWDSEGIPLKETLIKLNLLTETVVPKMP